MVPIDCYCSMLFHISRKSLTSDRHCPDSVFLPLLTSGGTQKKDGMIINLCQGNTLFSFLSGNARLGPRKRRLFFKMSRILYSCVWLELATRRREESLRNRTELAFVFLQAQANLLHPECFPYEPGDPRCLPLIHFLQRALISAGCKYALYWFLW